FDFMCVTFAAMVFPFTQLAAEFLRPCRSKLRDKDRKAASLRDLLRPRRRPPTARSRELKPPDKPRPTCPPRSKVRRMRLAAPLAQTRLTATSRRTEPRRAASGRRIRGRTALQFRDQIRASRYGLDKSDNERAKHIRAAQSRFLNLRPRATHQRSESPA